MKLTFTVQVEPPVTLPVHVLPPASVKSEFGAPSVATTGVPNVSLAATV